MIKPKYNNKPFITSKRLFQYLIFLFKHMMLSVDSQQSPYSHRPIVHRCITDWWKLHYSGHTPILHPITERYYQGPLSGGVGTR